MRSVLLVPMLLWLSSSSVQADGTHAFKQVNLANEDHYETECPPEVATLYRNAHSALEVLCAIRCATNSACSFFSVSDSQCSQWKFSLDWSYDVATFESATTLAYWPVKSGPSQARDVAIGKPVTAGAGNGNYASPSVLTYGTSCFPEATSCYGSRVEGNWVVVDLLESLPVTTIIVTAPTLDKISFFYEITIRAGNNGDTKDPIVGVTPSEAEENEAFQYTVKGNIRYIRLQNEDQLKSILVCKVQALL